MISFKQYCEEWIGLNRWRDEEGKWHASPLERKDYYKKHCQDSNIIDSYLQLLRLRYKKY